MKKFNKLVNIIITEAIQSTKLKELIDNNLADLTQEKNANNLNNLHWLFNDLNRKDLIPLNRENLEKFYEYLVNEKQAYIDDEELKSLIKKYISMYINDPTLKIVYANNIDNVDLSYMRWTFDFKPASTIDRDLKQILKEIDGANVPDEDVVVYTNDEIKNFNRAKRGEYQYVIACNNNKIIGAILFNDNGTIDYIVHYKYGRTDKINVSRLLDMSNKIYCIKYENYSAGIEKERYRNLTPARYKTNNPEKINEYDKRSNKKRYNDKKWEIKKNKEKQMLTDKLRTNLAEAKAVALTAKQYITDDDIFSTDVNSNNLFDIYQKLISAYRKCVELLNGNYFWDSEINRAISTLNVYKYTLNKLLEETNNE